jgi:hypothetical protein
MEVSGQLYAPATLPPGKQPRVPIGYDARGGSHCRSRRCGEQKTLDPAGTRTRTPEIFSGQANLATRKCDFPQNNFRDDTNKQPTDFERLSCPSDLVLDAFLSPRS